jgi:galactitol-specific phosphotransferase system IIB component
VYSNFNDQGKVIEKIISCENCNTLHKVYDICKSDIVKGGKDENKASITIEELDLQLPDKISKILEKNQCPIPIYEEVVDAIEKNIDSHDIVINREVIEGKYQVKVLNITKGKFRIKNETIEDEFIINR